MIQRKAKKRRDQLEISSRVLHGRILNSPLFDDGLSDGSDRRDLLSTSTRHATTPAHVSSFLAAEDWLQTWPIMTQVCSHTRRSRSFRSRTQRRLTFTSHPPHHRLAGEQIFAPKQYLNGRPSPPAHSTCSTAPTFPPANKTVMLEELLDAQG